MKPLPLLLGTVALATAAGIALAQGSVKEVPLTWHQAALSDGGELYVELCAACHGAEAKGDGPAAAAMKQSVPDLTGLAARNEGKFPRDMVVKTITGEARIASHGTGEMPVWGRVFAEIRPDWKRFRRESFARQQIYNLTAYLESIQAK